MRERNKKTAGGTAKRWGTRNSGNKKIAKNNGVESGKNRQRARTRSGRGRGIEVVSKKTKTSSNGPVSAKNLRRPEDRWEFEKFS